MVQEFTEQIEETARSVVNGIHTALPGIVAAFDSGKCVASVRPVGKYITSSGEKIDFPVISDVPVLIPCGTSGGIAFPISAGDSCLIICSEIELDEWRSGAVSNAQLRFDLSNAVCIPGLFRSAPDLVKRAEAQKATIISAGETEIAVSPGGIRMKGNLTVDGNVSATGSIG